jgi:small subunit ribosomal protein S6
MNSYETLYVIKPDLEDEARAALIQKFSAIITDNGGEVESVGQGGKDALIEVADGGIKGGQHTDRPQGHAENREDGGDE